VLLAPKLKMPDGNGLAALAQHVFDRHILISEL